MTFAGGPTIGPLTQRRPFFGVNTIAARAVEAAIADRDFYESSVTAAVAAREFVVRWCRERSLTCWDSDANFVLFGRFDDARAAWQSYLDRGV